VRVPFEDDILQLVQKTGRALEGHRPVAAARGPYLYAVPALQQKLPGKALEVGCRDPNARNSLTASALPLLDAAAGTKKLLSNVESFWPMHAVVALSVKEADKPLSPWKALVKGEKAVLLL